VHEDVGVGSSYSTVYQGDLTYRTSAGRIEIRVSIGNFGDARLPVEKRKLITCDVSFIFDEEVDSAGTDEEVGVECRLGELQVGAFSPVYEQIIQCLPTEEDVDSPFVLTLLALLPFTSILDLMPRVFRAGSEVGQGQLRRDLRKLLHLRGKDE
jgi:hypothetical protein